VPALDHAGHHGEGGGDRGEEVHVEGVAEVMFTDVDQADAGILGRIVDEQVDRALGGRHPVEGLPQVGRVGHVAGDGGRPRRQRARSAANAWRRSVVRARPTTVAPARARSRQSWAPSPADAPVTTATWPR
jgi:hypothetical protein